MILQQRGLEEALAALTMGTGGASTTSQSTTPSGATSLTPAIPSGATLGNPLGPSTRRHTIGFARFKTKQDALVARELLQGRKVDHFTGATLKVEMAKKNLHTKRATSEEELARIMLRNGRSAALAGGQLGEHGGYAAGDEGIEASEDEMRTADRYRVSDPNHGSDLKEAWNSLPQPPHPSKPVSISRGEEPRYSIDFHQPHYQQHPQSLPVYQQSSSLQSSTNPNSYPPLGTGATYPRSDDTYYSLNPYPHNQLPPPRTNSFQSATSYSTTTTVSSPSTSTLSPLPFQRPSISGHAAQYTDSKALLALAEEADELEMEMEWGLPSRGTQDHTPRKASRAFSHALQASAMDSGDGPDIGRGSQRAEAWPTSPSVTSEALSETGRSLGGNPADMNPPVSSESIILFGRS